MIKIKVEQEPKTRLGLDTFRHNFSYTHTSNFGKPLYNAFQFQLNFYLFIHLHIRQRLYDLIDISLQETMSQQRQREAKHSSLDP